MRSHLAWLGEKARAMRAADAQLLGAAEAEAKSLAGQLSIVREGNRRMAAEVAEAKAETARVQAARQAEVAELDDDLERVRTGLNIGRAHIAALERRLSMAADLLREVYISRDGYTVCTVCLLTWPSHRAACAIGKLENALDQRDGNRPAQPTGRRA